MLIKKTVNLLVSEINVCNWLVIDNTGLFINDTHLSLEEKKKVSLFDSNFKTDEQVQKPSIYHGNIRFQMYYTFTTHLNSLSFSNNFPVAKITYILSLFIAIDSNIRIKFYNSFNGPVPSILQFLLNNIRIGVLEDDSILSKYQLTDKCFEMITDRALANSFLNLTDDYNIERNFPYIIAWFVKLNQLDNQKNRKEFYFNHYVQLNKVPIVSNEKVLLPGLCIKGNKAFWYKSCQSFDVSFKKACQTISHSIKLNLYNELLDSNEMEYMFDEEYYVENVSLDVLERDLLSFILTSSPELKKVSSENFSVLSFLKNKIYIYLKMVYNKTKTIFITITEILFNKIRDFFFAMSTTKE